MFVGYSVDSKAYRLINFATRKIKISHDVIFYEGAKMAGFESNVFQDNEKTIGSMEVNQNPSLLRDNIEVVFATNVQQSTSTFTLKKWID
jgi:hypothetical protein